MDCPADPRRPAIAPLRAAAIGYRLMDGQPEFILVRTRDWRGWTFPKGHVEAAESTRQAALREAREEAGIVGEIEDRPLTRYRYQARTVFGLPAEVCVEAYLLRVVAQATPGKAELMRGPEWFTPDAAVARLSENRDAQWAREHRRLVNAAVKRLRAGPAATHPARPKPSP